jgi:flagellar L-ring protein precursor FlgH
VMPSSIAVGNMVPSTKLADSRVEYRTNSQLDAAELLKWLSRVFSTVLLL